MTSGFFSETSLEARSSTSQLALLVPRCGACGLYRRCNSPKMRVDGKGLRRVLVVGEAPGALEDETGRPFVGKSGDLLSSVFAGLDWSLRRHCWITNALICRPPGNKIPDPRMIDYCRPNVVSAINTHKPTVILLLGASAVASVVRWLTSDSIGQLSRWVGMSIPAHKIGAWICPTFHPSFVMREAHNQGIERLFRSHIESALARRSSPPDPSFFNEYQAKGWLRIEHDVSAVAKELDRFTRAGGTVAFDYETESIKPELAGTSIVCCAVCMNGGQTIVFPWHGEAVGAMRRLLRSENVRKIAANLKMEHRWSRHALGVVTRNWVFDTMLAAHVLDSRPGICSLGFQAFVELGVPNYYSHIDPFLTSDRSSNGLNQARSCPIDELMEYCATDAFLTFELAKRQLRRLQARRLARKPAKTGRKQGI
jgi:DNA polymerase